MKIAVRHEIPSMEASFIVEALREQYDVTELDRWDWRSHLDYYDLAICVGPVSSCPLARRHILIALGRTESQSDFDWDLVAVTSPKAVGEALSLFGHKTRVVKAEVPLFGLKTGQGRLVDKKRYLLHASEQVGGNTYIRRMSLWGDKAEGGMAPLVVEDEWKKEVEVFSDLEFNSAVRGGAIGFYPDDMIDGYDIQVRRHLALGGQVVCQKDSQVLGDLADFCLDYEEDFPEADCWDVVDPKDVAGDEAVFKDFILEIARR